jgi:hypothetical protein
MNRQEKISLLGGQSTPLLQKIQEGFGRLYADLKKKALVELFARFQYSQKIERLDFFYQPS